MVSSGLNAKLTMEGEFCVEKMVPSKRDKKTGVIYRLSRKLERKIDLEYDAEQKEKQVYIETDSDEEQKIVISGTSGKALLTSLKMTCSDSEDSFGVSDGGDSVSQAVTCLDEHPGTTRTAGVFGLPNEGSSKEFTTIVNMLRSMSEQLMEVKATSSHIRKEVANISDRLGRVERKVGISLATMEQVKDGMLLNGAAYENDGSDPLASRFDFQKISNEEEFQEFDSKLGNNEEYFANVKKWLTMQIFSNDPDNRMHVARDLIFDRKFMAQCSWTGHGKTGPKIAFQTQTNIIKLFVDIGSSKILTINEAFVKIFFMKKLRYAKYRLNQKGFIRSSCHKRYTTSL